MERIFLPEESQADDPDLAIAHGFEIDRTQEAEVEVRMAWTERLLVVRSHQYEQTTKKGLHRRLEKAEKALKALTPARSRGKRQIEDEASLLAAIQRIEERYRVAGSFRLPLRTRSFRAAGASLR